MPEEYPLPARCWSPYRLQQPIHEEQPVMMRHTTPEPQQRLSLRGGWCMAITAASVDNFKLGRWRG